MKPPIAEDEESLAKTLERTPVRAPTPTSVSLAPVGIDVAPSPARTIAKEQWVAVGAATLFACVLAGSVGVFAALTAPLRAEAAQATTRAPRVAVIVEVQQEVTVAPEMAPEKLAGTPAPESTTTPTATRPTPRATAAEPVATEPAPLARHAGFGHMGSDRDTAVAPARQAPRAESQARRRVTSHRR